MKSIDLSIQNKVGLHARPAANFVQAAQAFTANLTLIKGEKRVNAKSILSILTLDIRPNDVVRLEAVGTDEADAITALHALAARNFDEQV